MLTRTKNKQRIKSREPILHHATFPFWMQKLNIFDAHRLQSVSKQWQLNATQSEGAQLYYSEIDIHCASLADPTLFDDDALLRTMQMASTFIRRLHLVGLPSLVLPRRSEIAILLKGNSKMYECTILRCKSIHAYTQIGWLKTLSSLRTLKLNGCEINVREFKLMEKQLHELPNTIDFDLFQCEDEDGCENICGGDTLCHCELDTIQQLGPNLALDTHCQNDEDWENKKLCEDCNNTYCCSRCFVYFCKSNFTAKECMDCDEHLCQSCNDLEIEEKKINGVQNTNAWGCDARHGHCNCENLLTDITTSICSACAIKCPSCDANLCSISTPMLKVGTLKDNAKHATDWLIEPPCNEIKTCQYCEQQFCNNCRADQMQNYDQMEHYSNYREFGHCQLFALYDNADVRMYDGRCEHFTCINCIDQLFHCDCEEVRQCRKCLQERTLGVGHVASMCEACNIQTLDDGTGPVLNPSNCCLQ